jgi:Flp pilus assembly protein TadG
VSPVVTTFACGWRDERGSAVAEFAIALPAVLLVLATMLGGVQLGVLQLRVQAAAADAARSLGRGDSISVISERIARQVPSAQWTSSRGDGLVCVRLLARAPAPAGVLGLDASGVSCGIDEL